jgi:hypothetical protein
MWVKSVFLPEIMSNIASNKTSNTFTLMPDFLTRRNGTWHFARRVPTEFAHLDRRGVVKHSTKIRIASDRAAVRASRVAEKFNSNLEQHWRVLADSSSKDGVDSYNEARRRARQLGFDYIENAQLVVGPAAGCVSTVSPIANFAIENSFWNRRCAYISTNQLTLS